MRCPPVGRAFALVVASVALAACQQEGYRLELAIHAPQAGVLVAGSTIEVLVRDRQTRSGVQVVTVPVDAPAGTGGSVPVGIELHGGGSYDAHVSVEAAGGVFYATRCYSVGGTERSQVLLAGPLDADTDADADGWPAQDVCLAPGGGPCDAPCPALRAVDCNEQEPDIHPTALDLCQDQIDQDCSGNDALCGEDEGPDA